MTTVLVVNDDVQIQQLMETVLGYLGLERRQVYSLADAEAASADLRGIDVILWDANLGDGFSYELIARVKPTFGGLMIAASVDPACRQRQLLAGCDCELAPADFLGQLEQMLKPQPRAS